MKSLRDHRPYEVMYIDGMNLLSRSYHGMRELEYKGQRTGMLFGVSRLVIDWQKKCPGIEIVFLWEGGNSWRVDKYPVYKSHRDRVRDPQERNQFFECVQSVKQALPSMGVSQMWAETFEADDLVFSLSKKETRKAIFVSTDWDWWPLSRVGDVLYKNDILTEDDMKSRFSAKYSTDSISMDRLWVVKVLTGDPSDGVSGIPRFPKKLAVALANDPEVAQGSIIHGLIRMGEATWAERVTANSWILHRNIDLILPSPVPESCIETIESRRNVDDFGNILLKGGMGYLYDKLMGGSHDA